MSRVAHGHMSFKHDIISEGPGGGGTLELVRMEQHWNGSDVRGKYYFFFYYPTVGAVGKFLNVMENHFKF